MQNPVEEIILLPTNHGKQQRNENEVLRRSESSSDDEPHRNFFKGLIKPTNRTNLYKNILLWIILFVCFFLLAVPLALHVSYALPSVKSRTIPLNQFSEERARDLYSNLTQYGPRVTNTRADYLTRDFLITQINRIRSMAKNFIRFDISIQNFSIGDIDQLENIAVRVYNSNSSMDTPCLLLVAHYDSVEFSLGGSDDGSGVVTSLELLSNLVNDPEITFSQVHLIVLFTAAEEMGLMGAEMFVKHHRWKNDIRRFINLDSIGGNEKAILFRVKPSQLINDYRRVPRPHANIIGDEVLETIGSDTDYSMLTNNGLLLGYDFAFYLDGYNYHTRIDEPSVVEQGALQHLGENTLVLSRLILLGDVNLREPETITDEEDYVYFDVLGRYLITYKKSTSIIIQSILIGLVIVIGLFLIIFDHLWYKKNSSITDFSSVYFYFQNALTIRIISIIIFFLGYISLITCGIILSVVVAYIISKFRPLSWYGNATLAIFLYGLPCLIGMIICEFFLSKLRRRLITKHRKKIPMETNAISHIDRSCFNFERHWALLLIYVLLMGLTLYCGKRSLYFILVWSIFICPVYLILFLFEFIFRWSKKKSISLFNEQNWYWLFAPYIVSLIPLIHTLEMTSRLLRLMIPVMSRLFLQTIFSQDMMICFMVIVPAILFYLIFVPNLQRMTSYKHILSLLIISFIIVFIIACLRQPFTSKHPKIIQVEHDSYSFYRLNNPHTFPMILPIDYRNSTITIESYDRLVLSPTLDEISRKIGYKFNNQKCSIQTRCSFDDSSNRTIAFKQIELTSMNDSNFYQFTIRHVPSYQISIAIKSSANIIVHNSTIKPRSETIIDVELKNSSSTFELKIRIERCNLTDSPFLVSLTEKFSNIVMWGSGRCQALTDILHLSFSKF